MSSKSPASKTASNETVTFHSFELPQAVERALDDLGFTTPTPIQASGIPPALEGRDVLACAATGSGKTAAFLLPIIDRLMEDVPVQGKYRSTTRALVLTPTRELAAQIVEHFDALAKHTPLRAAAVYGGVGAKPQEQAFRSGVDVIVACPGRLLDHFQHDYAKLRDLDVLVLDEVDRMLDMGFLPDIRRVLRHVPEPDQALFYSATLPGPIARLAEELLEKPVKIAVERQSKPAEGIEQVFWPVPEKLKRPLLQKLIEDNDLDQVLVFTRTKHRANRLAEWLGKRGIVADRIHGNRSQAQRTRALDGFKKGKTRVLVATDIAARGIDIHELPHVVNFDVPNVAEDYIHRVGRTARASATGEAWSFVGPQDENDARAIERAVGQRVERRKLDDFDYSAEGDGPLEIPLRERLAQHRSKRADDRRRGAAKGRGGSSASKGGAGASRGGGGAKAGGGGRRRRGGQRSGTASR